MSEKTNTGWKAAALMLLAFMMLLTACSQSGKEPQNTVNDEGNEIVDSVTPEPEPEPEPEFTAPLTGLGLEEEATARPLAIMINNYGAARPQSGLTEADVVWEVLAEGGITRLVAIFQSSRATDMIGPIRSIRPYLIEMGEMYQSVLVHAGASNDGFAILQKQKKAHLDEITNAGAYFWRESFRKAPHNLYSNLEKLREGASKKNYKETVEIPVMKFAQEGAAAAGADASTVELYFSLKNYNVSYAYDADKKVYLRSINDRPHIDLNNDEQLSATNLVILGTNHKTLDDVGRLAVDLSMGGPAMLFQQGKVIECEWVRTSDEDVIRIMKDGEELPFIPGKTYYHIVPMTPTFADHINYE